MRVLLGGSSGFLGSSLADRLRADGHQLIRLVRRPGSGPDEISWNPATGELDPAELTGFDAVINLAGSPIGTRLGPIELPVRPWTARYRREFRHSRVASTATIANAIAAAPSPPGAFLAGAATGWYGDTGDREVDEQAPAGQGYLAEVASEWEAATEPAQAAGVRVVRLRTGFPLDRAGGFLGPQVLAFRLGLGGRLGSGKQWQPWISLTDWLAAVAFLLVRDDLDGPVNLVGPQPATNAEFTRTLGRLLHRPTVLPMPAPVLRALLGEFANDALASKRLRPAVLERAGFQFTHNNLEAALRAALWPDR